MTPSAERVLGQLPGKERGTFVRPSSLAITLGMRTVDVNDCLAELWGAGEAERFGQGWRATFPTRERDEHATRRSTRAPRARPRAAATDEAAADTVRASSDPGDVVEAGGRPASAADTERGQVTTTLGSGAEGGPRPVGEDGPRPATPRPWRRRVSSEPGPDTASGRLLVRLRAAPADLHEVAAFLDKSVNQASALLYDLRRRGFIERRGEKAAALWHAISPDPGHYADPGYRLRAQLEVPADAVVVLEGGGSPPEPAAQTGGSPLPVVREEWRAAPDPWVDENQIPPGLVDGGMPDSSVEAARGGGPTPASSGNDNDTSDPSPGDIEHLATLDEAPPARRPDFDELAAFFEWVTDTLGGDTPAVTRCDDGLVDLEVGAEVPAGWLEWWLEPGVVERCAPLDPPTPTGGSASSTTDTDTDTDPRDAATEAFDEIAAACGCPHWDYPGQLVRDVQALVRERDALRAERDELVAHRDAQAARHRAEVDLHLEDLGVANRQAARAEASARDLLDLVLEASAMLDRAGVPRAPLGHDIRWRLIVAEDRIRRGGR